MIKELEKLATKLMKQEILTNDDFMIVYNLVNKGSDYDIDKCCKKDPNKVSIPVELYKKLEQYGIINAQCRTSNVGTSNYSKHIIQPWAIWQDWDLNPWDADIVKRTLRTKVEEGENPIKARIQDYEKIVHICNERIRQLKSQM